MTYFRERSPLQLFPTYIEIEIALVGEGALMCLELFFLCTLGLREK